MFGISQDPITKNYILVFGYNHFEGFCKICFQTYTNEDRKWCNSCQINYLKTKFTEWTSGNKQIDDFIQKRQLRINYTDILFEWIPYSQFNVIKQIGNGDLITINLATWRNGPSYYYKGEWMRKSNEKVALKCFCNSQNITDELLNEV